MGESRPPLPSAPIGGSLLALCELEKAHGTALGLSSGRPVPAEAAVPSPRGVRCQQSYCFCFRRKKPQMPMCLPHQLRLCYPPAGMGS